MEILISLHSLVQHGVGFFKVLIYEEDTAFREIFRAVRDNPEEFSSTLSQLCLGIAVESSQCTFVEEHAYIMEKIEQMGAFRMLNENLSNIIEEWIFEMLNQVTQEVSNAGDEYELFNFRMCLAEVFSGMGRHFEALRQKEMCVAWHHKMLATHLENGNDDIIVPTISVADSMISVAESYARLNRFHDSLKFQEEAQKYYLRVLHQNDIRHANITSCIAQTHLSLENRNAAIQLIRSSLEMHRRVLPENDPRTLCAEAAVACMYRSAQNFEDAYDLEKQVLAKRLQVLPFNHPDIGSSYFNMAITLPLVESLPLSHKNWSVLHNLESALKVWKYSLKASDPRLQLVKQKIRVFQESIVKDASACVCPSDL
jgi:tetratricopeptide (TPR) repeat protein